MSQKELIKHHRQKLIMSYVRFYLFRCDQKDDDLNLKFKSWIIELNDGTKQALPLRKMDLELVSGDKEFTSQINADYMSYLSVSTARERNDLLWKRRGLFVGPIFVSIFPLLLISAGIALLTVDSNKLISSAMYLMGLGCSILMVSQAKVWCKFNLGGDSRLTKFTELSSTLAKNSFEQDTLNEFIFNPELLNQVLDGQKKITELQPIQKNKHYLSCCFLFREEQVPPQQVSQQNRYSGVLS